MASRVLTRAKYDLTYRRPMLMGPEPEAGREENEFRKRPNSINRNFRYELVRKDTFGLCLRFLLSSLDPTL